MPLIGQLILEPGGRGRAISGRLYGLPVLRAEADRSGFWGERRLRRAGRALRQGGALRVLVPRDFDRWPLLEAFGLRPVEPEDIPRANRTLYAAAVLALTAGGALALLREE